MDLTAVQIPIPRIIRLLLLISSDRAGLSLMGQTLSGSFAVSDSDVRLLPVGMGRLYCRSSLVSGGLGPYGGSPPHRCTVLDMLAVLPSLQHFVHLLVGHTVLVLTDNGR